MTKRAQREAIRLMKTVYLERVMQKVAPKKYTVKVGYEDRRWKIALLARPGQKSIGLILKRYPGLILGLPEKIVRSMVWGRRKK